MNLKSYDGLERLIFDNHEDIDYRTLSPGEILILVGLDSNEVKNQLLRTYFRTGLSVIQGKAREFRDSFLKVDGVKPKYLLDENEPYQNFEDNEELFKTLKRHLGEYNELNFDIPTHDFDELKSLINTYLRTDSSTLDDVTAEFTLFRPQEKRMFLAITNEKQRKKVAYKVATYLTLAKAKSLEIELDSNLEKEALKKEFSESKALNKACIEDFYRNRFVYMTNKSLDRAINGCFVNFPKVENYRIASGISKREVKRLKGNTEKLTDKFYVDKEVFQGKHYKAWHIDLSVSGNCKDLIFENQLVTFKWYVNNETDPDLSHGNYDGKLNDFRLSWREDLLGNWQRIYDNVLAFYNTDPYEV